MLLEDCPSATGQGVKDQRVTQPGHVRIPGALLITAEETLQDVQHFLFNLFAYPLVSKLRELKSKEGYAAIGGGSPLRKIKDKQANALKLALEDKDVSANFYAAMPY